MKNYRIFQRFGLRQVGLAVLCTALSIGLAFPTLTATPVQAQGGSRQLAVGDIVTASLNSQTFAQVYSLAASAGDTITIDVITDVEELAPAILVHDQRGNLIAQDADLTSATTASLADIAIPSNGTYYITVIRGSGADGTASGQFTLRLSGQQQIGGQTVQLTEGGITVEVVWNAAVDLNLEVRDPVGGTVHTFSPGTASGGQLENDTNAECTNLVSSNATETISWPLGAVPAGSYEIIVYYSDGCQTNDPQLFSLNASVNGEEQQSINGTLNPTQEYLARLLVDGEGGWSLQNGGVNAGLLNVAVFRNQIANADPIALGSTVSGVITNASSARAYSFDATAGTTVNIDLRAQSGSLDTYVALLGPDSAVLASNDDVTGSTDSNIQRSLVVDGTYTILASRYGLTIGGTEGEFTLAVSTLTGDEAAVVDTTGDTTTGDVGTGTGDELILTEGSIEVLLTWNSNADIQLSVRDPNGEAVYDDQPTGVRSGGILEADGNVRCEETTTSPVSYIYWPQNRLLPGVYEVEVWFQNTCDDNSSVTFDLSVTVMDQTIVSTKQQSAPNSHFMITFRIGQDGTATAGPGGFFDMSTASTLNYLSALPNATPIAYGQTVTGSITEQQRFAVYSFEGEQGDVVSIGMEQRSTNLDPALYLISPDGIQLNYNDDILPNGENRNSAIQEETLPFTGTYYIIATHYGLNVGGTEGSYGLTLLQD